MVTLTGMLSFSDLGSGSWILTTASGEEYSLHGDIPRSLLNRLVTVEGQFTMSMMMIGDAIKVVTVTEAPPETLRPEK